MAASSGAPDHILRRRAIALGSAGAFLVAAILIVASCGDDGAKSVAKRYSQAWQRQDFAAMYDQLSTPSKKSISLDAFVHAQQEALATATVKRLVAHSPKDWSDGSVSVPFDVETRAFGTLHLDAKIPVTDDETNAHVKWEPSLVLPGLNPGETLSRQVEIPPRATILAADGTVLAEGEQRTSQAPDITSQIVGTVGKPASGSDLAITALGYPQGTTVGQTGLERIFQTRLAGRPGGTLLAGSRVLSRTTPRAMPPLKTTIIPSIERAAVSALAGRYGSVAVTNPRTGEVMALAGVAFSEAAPPGSTFKIITATAGLESGAVTMHSTFPYETQALLDGTPLQNANGESCGGTFINSFAQSCNSVFAPLGATVGAEKLTATAHKYGFNRPMPGIPGAAISSVPAASKLTNPLSIGSVAIGQDEDLATPLEMTTVAATVGNGGFRAEPTLVPVVHAQGWRVTSAVTAAKLRTLMLAVVRDGTGTSAAIPGVAVAGKTGTAELRDTTDPAQANNPANTDAWFVAFAPAFAPKVAVGVLLNGAGAGGETAAPAAHDVLVAALQALR